MKRNMAAILLIPFIIMGCNKDKIASLSKEKEQLAFEKNQLNQELEDYMRTFNTIELNLAAIKKREDKINLKARGGVEYGEDAKVTIVKDIQAINHLMIDNQKKMDLLESELNNTNSEFKKMVAHLNQRVQDKNKEIAGMKKELEMLNFEKTELAKAVETLEVSVDTLRNKTNFQQLVINEQHNEIEEKEKELNTGFVAVGSSKELRESKVIDKEGGILGLGSTETLNNEVNESAFNKINIRETINIPVDSRRVELITPHPEGSYKLEMNEANQISRLVILDPSRFWHSSKYLVVMVD